MEVLVLPGQLQIEIQLKPQLQRNSPKWLSKNQKKEEAGALLGWDVANSWRTKP